MVFPLLVVGACVGIFLIFGLISVEPRTLSDYLLDMRTGGAARRWHAAFELSKKLANQRGLAHPQETTEGEGQHAAHKESGPLDQGFVQSLLDLYEKSKHDDPRMRQYLALCLGYVQGPGVREALMGSLTDTDSLVRFYAIWSLAVQHDTQAVPRMLEMLKDEDPHLRKVIIYALGTLRDTRAIPDLKGHLDDPQIDVQWNAALALARLGDGSGIPILKKMLDRSYLKDIHTMNDRQREQVLINAIRASALLSDASLMSALENLSGQDPDLKVREAALAVLKEKK